MACSSSTLPTPSQILPRVGRGASHGVGGRETGQSSASHLLLSICCQPHSLSSPQPCMEHSLSWMRKVRPREGTSPTPRGLLRAREHLRLCLSDTKMDTAVPHCVFPKGQGGDGGRKAAFTELCCGLGAHSAALSAWSRLILASAP